MATKRIPSKKEFAEQQAQPFFTKKRVIIITLCIFISVALVVLAMLYVLKIDFGALFSLFGKNATSKQGLLAILISLGLIRPLFLGIPIVIRLKQMGYKTHFWQTCLYGFILTFLTAISPANLITDPYTLFWVKSHGVNNKESYCITSVNGFICQVAQVLITVPSFCLIAARYNDFHAKDPAAEFVYWLMVCGMIIDFFILAFFFVISFSKHFTYYLSLTFNKVKKLFHLKYHTKEEVKEKYLIRAEASKTSIEMIKRWWNTFFIFAVYLVIEVITYVFVYCSVQWIAEDNISLNFGQIFNCANVAITANKMIPLPGGQVSLDMTLKWMLQVCGGNQIDDKLAPNSIMVYRLFCTYIPSVLGVLSFAGLCVIQYKSFKKTKLQKNAK